MFSDDVYPLNDRRRRKMFPGCKKMFDLIEYPWIPYCSASDHYSIYTITVAVLNCFLRAVNISISKYRDRYSWIIFYGCYECPIGFPLIQLCTRSSMNSNGLNTYILQS